MQKRKKKRNAKHLSWTTSLSNILSIVVTSGIFAVELWAFLNSSGGLSDQLPSLTERHLECENMSILLYKYMKTHSEEDKQQKGRQNENLTETCACF